MVLVKIMGYATRLYGDTATAEPQEAVRGYAKRLYGAPSVERARPAVTSARREPSGFEVFKRDVGTLGVGALDALNRIFGFIPRVSAEAIRSQIAEVEEPESALAKQTPWQIIKKAAGGQVATVGQEVQRAILPPAARAAGEALKKEVRARGQYAPASIGEEAQIQLYKLRKLAAGTAGFVVDTLTDPFSYATAPVELGAKSLATIGARGAVKRGEKLAAEAGIKLASKDVKALSTAGGMIGNLTARGLSREEALLQTGKALSKMTVSESASKVAKQAIEDTLNVVAQARAKPGIILGIPETALMERIKLSPVVTDALRPVIDPIGSLFSGIIKRAKLGRALATGQDVEGVEKSLAQELGFKPAEGLLDDVDLKLIKTGAEYTKLVQDRASRTIEDIGVRFFLDTTPAERIALTHALQAEDEAIARSILLAAERPGRKGAARVEELLSRLGDFKEGTDHLRGLEVAHHLTGVFEEESRKYLASLPRLQAQTERALLKNLKLAMQPKTAMSGLRGLLEIAPEPTAVRQLVGYYSDTGGKAGLKTLLKTVPSSLWRRLTEPTSDTAVLRFMQNTGWAPKGRSFEGYVSFLGRNIEGEAQGITDDVVTNVARFALTLDDVTPKAISEAAAATGVTENLRKASLAAIATLGMARKLLTGSQGERVDLATKLADYLSQTTRIGRLENYVAGITKGAAGIPGVKIGGLGAAEPFFQKLKSFTTIAERAQAASETATKAWGAQQDLATFDSIKFLLSQGGKDARKELKASGLPQKWINLAGSTEAQIKAYRQGLALKVQRLAGEAVNLDPEQDLARIFVSRFTKGHLFQAREAFINVLRRFGIPEEIAHGALRRDLVEAPVPELKGLLFPKEVTDELAKVVRGSRYSTSGKTPLVRLTAEQVERLTEDEVQGIGWLAQRSGTSPTVVQRAGQIYSTGYAWWKFLLTAARPGFQGIQALGSMHNVMFLGGAWDPRRMLTGLEIMAIATKTTDVPILSSRLLRKIPGAGDVIQAFINRAHHIADEPIKTASGEFVTRRQMAQELIEMQVRGQGVYTSELNNFLRNKPQLGGNALQQIFKGVFSTKDNYVSRLASTASQMTALNDDFFRTFMYVEGRVNKGLEKFTSRARVSIFHMNFEDLTPPEQVIRGYVVPFYTWLRKNAELQLSQLIRSPRKAAAIIRAKGYLEQDDDALFKKALTPAWLDEAFAVLPTKGMAVSTAAVPLFDPFRAASARGVVSALSPVVQSAIALGLKIDPFTGDPISKEQVKRKLIEQYIPPAGLLGRIERAAPEEKAHIVVAWLTGVRTFDVVPNYVNPDNVEKLTGILATLPEKERRDLALRLMKHTRQVLVAREPRKRYATGEIETVKEKRQRIQKNIAGIRRAYREASGIKEKAE